MNITGVWMTHLIVVDWRWASDGLRALRSSVGRHCRHSDCLTSGALRGIAQSSLCLCVFRCSPLTNQAGGGRRREAEGAAAFVSSCRLRYRCLLSRPLGSCAKPFATKSGLRSRRPGLNGADPPESAVLTPGDVGRNYAWRVVEISCAYESVRECTGVYRSGAWGVGRIVAGDLTAAASFVADGDEKKLNKAARGRLQWQRLSLHTRSEHTGTQRLQNCLFYTDFNKNKN